MKKSILQIKTEHLRLQIRKIIVDFTYHWQEKRRSEIQYYTNFGGDSKTDQNHFLLEPVSIENLHNNRGTRNFWCRVEGKRLLVSMWSFSGAGV